MDSKQHHLHRILMLPWLAHGHISPFLELAKKLAERNFEVFICSSPVNLRPFRNLSSNNLSGLIKFMEIHLPSTSELPPERHCTKNLPPHLMPALKTAFDDAREGFRDIIRELEPALVVYDFTQPWAPVVAREESIPAVLFITFSAAACSFLYHNNEDYQENNLNFTKREREKMVQFTYDVSNGLTDKERYFQCINSSSSCILIKTLNEAEYKHIHHLSNLVGKEVVPVGPLVQEPEENSGGSGFTEWLDQKQHSSAVFASFGSEYFLSRAEIEEIAHGLELSMVSFILVVRFHDATLSDMLPEGFLERVRGRGNVVEGWAPQGQILRHTSIGGFVSHCGRSSLMESVSFGVPMVAMPMHLDQPLNAKLVTEIGVGIEVPRKNGQLSREDIARVIREVVVEERGEEIRKKVREMSKTIKQAGDKEVDHTVEKLLQIIRKP